MSSKPKKPRTEETKAVFVVERILDRRLGPNGKGEEFLIKWQGFPDHQSTWEPRSNLQCHELLDKFEKTHHIRAAAAAAAVATQNQASSSRRSNPQSSPRRSRPNPRSTDTDDTPSGDEDTSDIYGLKGKSLKKIIGITKVNSDVHILCQFTDESCLLLPSKVASANFPMDLIRYYESKITMQQVQDIHG